MLQYSSMTVSGDAISFILGMYQICVRSNRDKYNSTWVILSFVSIKFNFSASHRAHASTEGVASFVDISVAGFSMRDEIAAFEKLITNPEHPVAAIIGGAKLSSKISVLRNLLPKIDKLLIGGAMVFTFYRAMGLDVGASLCEESSISVCHSIIEAAAKQGVQIIFAPDVVVAERLHIDAPSLVVGMDEIPEGFIGLDIGPGTLKVFEASLQDCKTILWNGMICSYKLHSSSNILIYTSTILLYSILMVLWNSYIRRTHISVWHVLGFSLFVLNLSYVFYFFCLQDP